MPVQELTTATGYGEWANRIISIQSGCSYDGYGPRDAGACRYCWARAQACRFHRHTPASWTTPTGIDWALVHKTNWGLLPGITAYPGTHDISLDLVGPTIQLLSNLLREPNRILLVTKPRYYAVKAICDTFRDHPNRNCITWRFTITSWTQADLAYWEPNSPPLAQREAAFDWAHRSGYAVSVNTEPLTCRIAHVPSMLAAYSLEESESGRPVPIWVGLMNKADRRVVSDPEGRLPDLLADQCPENVNRLYDLLKEKPWIRWKNSIKDMLGLPRNPRPGMDI